MIGKNLCYSRDMALDRNLLEDPIPHLVRSIAIPASAGYLFNILFKVIDTWFAGQISTDALAALSLSFPVFFVVIAVASGLSTGVSALLANVVGSGRTDEACTLASRSLLFTIFASVAITAIGMAGCGAAFRAMGAVEEPARLATDYMTIIFGGSVFFNLNFLFNAFLVARGDTHTYRNVLLAGVVLNAILDPWFIYGGFGIPAMGFNGIAASTVLIQAGASLYLYAKVRRDMLIKYGLAAMRPDIESYRQILAQSGPAILNMSTIGIGMLVLTYFVNEHGTAAVAAYGIATRIEQIVLLPAIGLNVAVLAIVGQNNGAGQFARAREAVKSTLRFGGAILVPGSLAMILFPDVAMRVFSDDPAVIAPGAQYLRVAAFILYAYVILFVMAAALQVIKLPMVAVWIGLYRQLIAPVVIIYGLSRWTDLGLWSVWISVFFTTWSSAFVIGWYTNRRMPIG